jgi:hypothetical protein
MIMDENVVQMPSLLDRLAVRLKGLLVKEAVNRQEWIDIQMDTCLTLAEMRSQFPANNLFGKWCEINGFGESVLDTKTRANAIKMGKEPEALRKCLSATELKSIRRIYVQDWPRYGTGAKTDKTVGKKRGRKTSAVCAAVRETVESGEPLNQNTWAERLGVSRLTVQLAMQHELGRVEGREEAQKIVVEPLNPAEMTPSMRDRYDAAVRAMRREIRQEEQAKAAALFHAKEEELHTQYDLYVKRHGERLAVADKLLANYAGIMSEKEFNTILYCLHPDSRMRDATEAFQIFNEKKSMLVKPMVYSGPPLPRTAADLLRQRKGKC